LIYWYRTGSAPVRQSFLAVLYTVFIREALFLSVLYAAAFCRASSPLFWNLHIKKEETGNENQPVSRV